MKVRVVTRGGNTREMFVGDPAGIVFQLHDVSYCGGSGPLGNMCQPEPAPTKGLLAVKDMSHFTHLRAERPVLPGCVWHAGAGDAGDDARIRRRTGRAFPDVHRGRGRGRGAAPGGAARRRPGAGGAPAAGGGGGAPAAPYRSRLSWDGQLRPGGGHENAHRLRPQARGPVGRRARHLYLAASGKPAAGRRSRARRSCTSRIPTAWRSSFKTRSIAAAAGTSATSAPGSRYREQKGFTYD